MIKIIIIDKHESERNRSQTILASQNDFEIVGQGKDSYDALVLVKTHKPHIAILDICLDIIDGIEIAPLLKQTSPSTTILLLTSLADEKHICKAAARHEVQGYILKDTDIDTLVTAVRHVYHGGCFISPTISNKTYRIFSNLLQKMDVSKPLSAIPPKAVKSPKASSVLENISNIELQIMTYISQGYTTKEIAERFSLAAGTVRNYLSSGMQKAGLQHRTQIPLFAIRHGLISP
ncbi:MAG: response regulator transcription factor [Treponema sp.]|jgi:DNA-binding NarL/FixJ family response regulator|nr:response regulator transcription factor [Treponema sp.]